MIFWQLEPDGTALARSTSEADTEDLGRRLAEQLRPGDVVALTGDLGAGKTRFVKAIAAACGVAPDEVNSPTFTLIHEYAGRIPLRHCDTYRLKTVEEFADLGLDELFAPDGVACIEWAERVAEFLPRDRVAIQIAIETPTDRTLAFRGTGDRSHAIIQEMFRRSQMKPTESSG